MPYEPSALVQGYLLFLLVIFVGEIIFHLVFYIVRRVFGLVSTGNTAREVFKGVLERLMISIGLAHGIITIIIAFGALKVATKLSLSASDQEPDQVQTHNDYFLVGNVMSLIFAMAYALIAVHLHMVVFKLS
jgi:hypothetical protein